MGALAKYFAAIGRTVVTLGDGLAVTASYLFRKPVTLQYPDRMKQPLISTLPERSRGLLEVDPTSCTGCVACERACPIGCIHIEISKGKERVISRFDIELAKCMFCGLCAEACPSAGLRHSHEFEGGMANVDNLIVRFIKEPRPVAKPVKKGDPEVEKPPLGSIILELLPGAWDEPKPAPVRAPVAEPAAPAVAAEPKEDEHS